LLPAEATVTIASSDSADQFELLVEDSAATVVGPGIREEAPAAVSGRSFRRYTGRNIAGTDALRISAPTRIASSVSAPGTIAVSIALAMGVVLVLTLRAGATVAERPASSRALAPPAGTA
jgi:hypothetical protein